MIDVNKLRRLAQAATPGPWKMVPVGDGRQKFSVANSKFLSILTVTDEGGATFGTVYDDADAQFIATANPSAILDLLDRLEAAERERDEGNRRRLEAADHFAAQTALMKKKYDDLRAKIEAMERQEPVAWTTKLALEYGASTLGFRVSSVNIWGEKGVPLYALPGAKAQPAPSVPEGWKLVPIEPTHEMLDAGEDTFVPTYTGTPASAPIDVYRAMLAAAPEAKQCQ